MLCSEGGLEGVLAMSVVILMQKMMENYFVENGFKFSTYLTC